MTTDKLPPLPKPKTVYGSYESKDMHEYGALCRQQALEEAAQVCDDLWQHDGNAYDCREAIRSLIK